MPRPSGPRHLLFDLDGTLTDSGPGIVNCVNYGLSAIGREAVAVEAIRGLIGASLSAIFARLLGELDTAAVTRAIDAYRERFNDVGMFENALYPGIAEALEHLASTGRTLQLVTAKPLGPARRVVEHFRIDRYFVAVHAPGLDQARLDKADLVAAALAHAGVPAAGTAMVGDRREDMLAARAHGVSPVGAGWGYGSADELGAAGAVFVAPDVARLLDWIGP